MFVYKSCGWRFESHGSHLSEVVETKILLFGENTLSAFSNILILNSTIHYVIFTKRFDGSILNHG